MANHEQNTEGCVDCVEEENFALEFHRDPSTLHERLQGIKCPIHYKVREFTRNPILEEQRFTRNGEFMHESKFIENHYLWYKNNQCALCLHGRTNYCYDCKVRLCCTAKSLCQLTKSCFHIWHSMIDMSSCAQRIRNELELKSARKKANKLMMGKVVEGSEDDDNNSGNDNIITSNQPEHLDVVTS
jgi:hypothetical protein